MSTGGIALVLNATPHRFPGLRVIGDVVFVLTLVIFALTTIGISTRFILFPGTLSASLLHPTESLFFPTFWLGIATILSNIQNYGVSHTGDWLSYTMLVLFWIYTACTFIVGVAHYHLLFTQKALTSTSMTPSWILPIFPVMLVGTIASATAPSQAPHHALPIMVAGITFQGLGFLVSCFMYALYINRLMTAGLPKPAMRPGMFIAVGPPGFTSLALLGLSSASYDIYPDYTTISGVQNPSIIPDVLRIMAVVFAIFIWSLALFFFSVSLIAVVHGIWWEGDEKRIGFHLSWWSFVFPNVGLTISLIDIGEALGSQGIQWVGSVMAVLLVAMWIFVAGNHVWAVWRKKILWPGKDEDHDQ